MSTGSKGWYEVFIYETSTVDATSKLPLYSFGFYRKWAVNFYKFQTNDYTFSYGSVDTDTTYSEISRANITNTTGSSAGLISGRRFKSGFDTNMASYVTAHTDIVMAKTTSSAVQYATGGQFGHVPPWTFIKNIGTGFSETSGGGNIICNKAGTIKVTTKCFFSSGGNQTRACYVRHNGVDISDTGTTAVVNNSNTLYNEALVDVAANDTININVQKRVDNSTALNLQGQSTIIVEYIAYS